MKKRFKRQLTISKDDPFAMVFIDPEDVKKQIALKLKKCFQQKNQEKMARQEEKIKRKNVTKTDSLECSSTGPVLFKQFEKKKQFFPNFDGTKDSGVYGNKGLDSDDESEMIVDCSGGGYHW